ncbi:hypothetical protein MNEG_9958 [Monoraphidium neglectum]|uniref:Uncharacterized protein n=1 Tax=Monoraphidium neglectum TaxID=145388 RepID=A0A0D2KQY6_9CHLO|nr:hypothetical protein MNEG_9958 [Monoraphidium neglectum]KIY98003.1 hypothetical protein MNEG_9958 [Monoraphidium neglectum]|eukprot:XP_013897023.1 hypothetical protein MNEG_9958 [Monoraphidium neglectum]
MADRPAFRSGRAVLRPALRTCAIGGGLAAGSAALWRHQQQQQGRRGSGDAAAPAHVRAPPRLRLSAAAIEAFAGAMGEVAQISLLYPLDTIKVRCQAQGVPARVVIAALSRLGPRAAAAQLFAGARQAAVASVLVGAVHFMSFCSAKRLVSRREGPAVVPAEGAGRQDEGRQQEQQQGQQQQQRQQQHHLVVSHGASGSHFTPVSDALCGADGAGVDAGGGGGGADEGHGGAGGMKANLAAAVLAAVATAVVEAPLELFRHNAQAGTGAMGGDFFGAMWRVRLS